MKTLALAALIAAAPAGADPCRYDGNVQEHYVLVNEKIPDLGTASSPAIYMNHASWLEVVDVVVAIGIEHAYSGDLIVSLIYTPAQGPPNVVSRLLERPAGASGTPGTCDEPLIWFGLQYEFQDGSQAPWECGLLPGNRCYEAADRRLDDFFGVPGNEGFFWVQVQDAAEFDAGYFHDLRLYVTLGPVVSVDANTWGQVKARYRP